MGNNIDIEAIRKRAEAATPGPWDYGGSVWDGEKVTSEEWIWERTGHLPGDPDAPDTRICAAPSRDATFIAHSRTDVPALCDEVERLREAVRECSDVLAKLGAISDMPWSREFVALQKARAALEGR